MGCLEGEAEESGLDNWKQPYCPTDPPRQSSRGRASVLVENKASSLR